MNVYSIANPFEDVKYFLQAIADCKPNYLFIFGCDVQIMLHPRNIPTMLHPHNIKRVNDAPAQHQRCTHATSINILI